MAVYRVHVGGEIDPLRAAETARFLREGFAFWALVFGPFWLLAKRLWLELAVWLAAASLVALAIRFGFLPRPVAGWLYGLSAVWLGLEGRSLLSDRFARGGAQMVDVCVGEDRIAAERAFFLRWTAPEPAESLRASGRSASASASAIIGLFPEAGG